MKNPFVILGVLIAIGGCLLWGMCGVAGQTIARTNAKGDSVVAADGYWNHSCVTGDGKWIAAGGDHFALLDAATGKVTARHGSQVKAVACEQASATLIAYDGAFKYPGKTVVNPAADPPGTAIGLTPKGEWISWNRTIAGRAWRGPAMLYVTAAGSEPKRFELLPGLFGKVGEGKALPLPDSFAVRFGGMLDDGRVLVAAGWQPNQSGAELEAVPWGFFAVNVATGNAAAATLPLPTDGFFHQGLMQKVASTFDAAWMAAATHDGKRLAVGTFAQGAEGASRRTEIPAKGSPSAIAIAANGQWTAVGTEARGRDAPGFAAVVDQAGQVIWRKDFAKTVTGVHFVGNDLIVTAASTEAVRVTLPAGTEVWKRP